MPGGILLGLRPRRPAAGPNFHCNLQVIFGPAVSGRSFRREVTRNFWCWLLLQIRPARPSPARNSLANPKGNSGRFGLGEFSRKRLTIKIPGNPSWAIVPSVLPLARFTPGSPGFYWAGPPLWSPGGVINWRLGWPSLLGLRPGRPPTKPGMPGIFATMLHHILITAILLFRLSTRLSSCTRSQWISNKKKRKINESSRGAPTPAAQLRRLLLDLPLGKPVQHIHARAHAHM